MQYFLIARCLVNFVFFSIFYINFVLIPISYNVLNLIWLCVCLFLFYCFFTVTLLHRRCDFATFSNITHLFTCLHCCRPADEGEQSATVPRRQEDHHFSRCIHWRCVQPTLSAGTVAHFRRSFVKTLTEWTFYNKKLGYMDRIKIWLEGVDLQ